MSNYAIANLRELKNVTSDPAVDIEARFARSQLESEHLGVSLFRYGPGFRAPIGHRHREQEEAYVIVGGSGKVKLDDQVVSVKQWDVIRVAPGTARAFEGGPDGLELIAIGSDRPEGGDGERIEGFWTD